MGTIIQGTIMKIIYIYDTMAIIGGVERIFIDKMNYLADKFHDEVYLLTSSQGNHPISFPLSPNVKHIDLGIRHHIQYQYRLPKRLWIKYKLKKLCHKRLKETVEKIDPDILVATTTYLSAEICRLKCRAKKIIESHGARDFTHLTDNFKMGFPNDQINRFNTHRRFRIIEKYSDAVVTLTQSDAQAWSKAAKVYVIPNFTNFASSQSSSCETKRAIAVGRLTYQKGFDRLIDAWKMVNKSYPDWKLDIFGEGIRQQALNEQIQENGLDEIVTIHPFTSHIKDEYINSSIFTLSSNYEGFVLVLLEAMSCGLPCVSFDCPNGPAEAITDKEDGLLVRNGDIEGFANALCYLIENEEERKAFGKKAKQNVKRYSPENIMPQWEKLFKDLTSQ